MVKLTKIEQYVIDRIREERIKRGWDQIRFSVEMNLSSGFVGQVESNKNDAKYNLNHIAAAAKAFNCSPRIFLPEDIAELQ